MEWIYLFFAVSTAGDWDGYGLVNETTECSLLIRFSYPVYFNSFAVLIYDFDGQSRDTVAICLQSIVLIVTASLASFLWVSLSSILRLNGDSWDRCCDWCFLFINHAMMWVIWMSSITIYHSFVVISLEQSDIMIHSLIEYVMRIFASMHFIGWTVLLVET